MTSPGPLSALIARMNQSPVQSRGAASALHKAHFAKAFDWITETGTAFDRPVGPLAMLALPEDEFRQELRSADNDLDRQIEIVNYAFDRWYEIGEIPAPYYPWRIAVILSKAKRKDEEAAFLTAWCRHFGDTIGGRYEALAQRAAKLGAIGGP